MTRIKALLLTFGMFLLINSSTQGQDSQKRVWKGKRCAVCLTYDDGLDVHLKNVIRVLDSLGIKGTFNLMGFSLQGHIDDWRAVAAKGHELGNHSLFHPCNGQLEGRGWVKTEYDLMHYSFARIIDEIRMQNILLEAVDGKSQRTYAYPCGDLMVGDSSYVDKIKDYVIAGRGSQKKIEQIDKVNLYNIGSYGVVTGETADDLIREVKNAMASGGLIVIQFHGVGGGHSIDIPKSEHDKFVRFLKQNEKDIWISTFLEIAQYIKEYNKMKPDR